jgi:hypothetical protein
MIQELVTTYTLQTLSHDERFVCLSPEMRLKFNKAVSPLISIENTCPNSPVVVYRGVSKKHLEKTLSRNRQNITEEKLLSRLFFYGEKARAFHAYNEKQANLLPWLKKIEDCSEETCRELFSRIHGLLARKDGCISFISQDSQSFSKFFQDEMNSSIFVSKVCELGTRARDYYLYFLHTYGSEICNQSFLVSTSSDYQVALDFANGDINKFIIIYAIPKPIEMHAIGAESHSSSENILYDQGLPLYNCAAHYPEEKEYAIRGGLFPHYMIGVIAIHSSKLCANPHLFSQANLSSYLLSGLKMDQSDFETKIGEETQYKRALATVFEEGRSRTINL